MTTDPHGYIRGAWTSLIVTVIAEAVIITVLALMLARH